MHEKKREKINVENEHHQLVAHDRVASRNPMGKSY
jgi:hypothetical protein